MRYKGARRFSRCGRLVERDAYTARTHAQPDLTPLKSIFSARWLIVVLPVGAALGPYALPFEIAGINLFAFRLLILVVVLFSTPLTSGSGWWFNMFARRAMLFGVLWLFSGMVGLLWTTDLAQGLNDLLSISFGFALLLVLLTLHADKSHNLQLLRRGWVLAFLVTSVIAVWEIVTGQHLDSGMFLERPEYFDGSVVQSTLGLPGAYGGFLVLTLPFLLWSFYRSKGPKKLAYAVLIAAAGALILLSANRLSFIAFAAEVMLLMFIFDRRWYVIMLGFLALGAGYAGWSYAFLSSDLRIAAKFRGIVNDGPDNSISARVAMTVNGLWLVYDTGGLGVGPSGFAQAAFDPDAPLPLSEPKMAHNFWVQVASEYGIVVAVALVVLLVFVARLALLAANRNLPGAPLEVRTIGIVILVALVGYLFFGVVVGSVLRHTVHWMFFASLMIMATHLYQVRAAYAARTRLRREPALAGVALSGTSLDPSRYHPGLGKSSHRGRL